MFRKKYYTMLSHDVQITCLQLLAIGELMLAAECLMENTKDDMEKYQTAIHFCYRISAINKRETVGSIDATEAQIKLNLIALSMIKCVFDRSDSGLIIH